MRKGQTKTYKISFKWLYGKINEEVDKIIVKYNEDQIDFMAAQELIYQHLQKQRI